MIGSLDDAPPEHELKLLAPRHRESAATAFVTAVCRPAGEYPVNRVVSLYYDTPDMEMLREKLDSHRVKGKVRLRWYEDPASARPSGAAFAELKLRIGSRRRKVRVRADHSAAELAALPLHHRTLAAVPDLLPRYGGAPRRFRPVGTVRYRRRRFFEPESRSRVSIDTEIGLGRLDRRRGWTKIPGRLPETVIEIKNRSGEIPPRLRPLVDLGCRLAAFSKYAACLERVDGGNLRQ